MNENGRTYPLFPNPKSPIRDCLPVNRSSLQLLQLAGSRTGRARYVSWVLRYLGLKRRGRIH